MRSFNQFVGLSNMELNASGIDAAGIGSDHAVSYALGGLGGATLGGAATYLATRGRTPDRTNAPVSSTGNAQVDQAILVAKIALPVVAGIVGLIGGIVAIYDKVGSGKLNRAQLVEQNYRNEFSAAELERKASETKIAQLSAQLASAQANPQSAPKAP